nr:RNA-directed DNA polymerase [uncultured Treponema sp.]
MGLGSQVSQISAISYPNKLDHYCKEVLRIKYYGRYMDDTYLIHSDKKYLEYCLSEIKRICDELGIKLNPKKTRIVSLDEGFWFLKGKYILLESGKIICKPARDGALRMRRKLRKFLKMVEEGTMSLSDVYTSYQSFRSHLMQFDSYHIVHNMDKYYAKLFVHNYSLLYDEPRITHKNRILSERNRCIMPISRVTVKKMSLLAGV